MAKYLFLISRSHPDIAKAEIEIQTRTKAKELLPGVLEVELDSIPPKAKIFGYTKQIFKLKKKLNKEGFLEKTEFDELIQNSYKINILGNANFSTKELADKIYDRLTNPKVDIKNPDHNYFFLFTSKNIFLLEELSKNSDKTNERKAHKKRNNHPTSLDPKLAKAIINLADTKEFYDPFCGVGGLLIEGALKGLKVSGSDISGELIEKAKENAKEFQITLNVSRKNALNINNELPVIISDLPYGKNSRLTDQKEKLYAGFLKQYENLTTKMVIGLDDTVNLKKLIKNTKWKIEKGFTIYVHKSLSRKIYLLKKQKT